MLVNVKISIIIPVYNTPNYKIERCVNSIITQTFQEFEIIIVDDGSCKECANYIDSLSIKDKRIRIIHKENEGSAVARNVGVLNAKYEYMTFIDSDDFITSYALSEAAELIQKYSPDMVVGLAQRFTENDISALSYEIRNNTQVIEVKSDAMLDEYINHMLGYSSKKLTFRKGFAGDGPWAKVCRTDIARNTLFSKESFWNDDTIWNLKITRECKKIVVTDNIWYAYLTYDESKTRKFRENCPDEFKYRVRQELDLIKTLWPNCLKGIYIRIWRDMNILCRTYLFHKENNMRNCDKYKVFVEAIHMEEYIEMLRNIDFNNENNVIKKIFKYALRCFSLYGPNLLAYFIWKCVNRITCKL